MSALAAHLLIVPIVLPLAAGALMLLFDEHRHALKATISVVAWLLVLAAASALVFRAQTPVSHVYPIGNWPVPVGIILVADRLAALMVLLASVLGFAALAFSLARWHRVGPHFHSFLQFMLAGLNGAFLTGDLFNLFVFFELMLAASYALALYGGGVPRVRASLHYIVINLAASLLLLVGVSLMYGATGTPEGTNGKEMRGEGGNYSLNASRLANSHANQAFRPSRSSGPAPVRPVRRLRAGRAASPAAVPQRPVAAGIARPPQRPRAGAKLAS